MSPAELFFVNAKSFTLPASFSVFSSFFVGALLKRLSRWTNVRVKALRLNISRSPASVSLLLEESFILTLRSANGKWGRKCVFASLQWKIDTTLNERCFKEVEIGYHCFPYVNYQHSERCCKKCMNVMQMSISALLLHLLPNSFVYFCSNFLRYNFFLSVSLTGLIEHHARRYI